MKKKLLAVALFTALSIPTFSVFAADPTFGVDVVTEYTKISDTPGIFEETLRLRFDEVTDNFYIHARARAHMINNKAFDSIDNSTFDQAYAGHKFGGVDVRAGKQWLYLGHGLLADLNVSGVQATATAGATKILGFYSKDVKAANITAKIGQSSLGATYKKQNDPLWNLNPASDIDSTWSMDFDTPIGKTVLGGEYAWNRTKQQHGYIASLTSGEYSLSYRDIESAAIDPNWATNYHFADSKGFRLRGDFKMNQYAILTIYQDFAKNHAGTERQNITYIGYAMYF